MGTTTAQKKLFFNLKKLKNQITPSSQGDLRNEHVDEISKRLDVKKEEVISMNRRMQGNDKSLNTPINNANGEKGEDWQDWLVDKNLDQELLLSQKQEMARRKELMNNSLSILNEREKEILNARRLSDEKITLDDLSKKYKISRERIRQIESTAFEKLQKAMLNSSKSKNLLPKN